MSVRQYELPVVRDDVTLSRVITHTLSRSSIKAILSLFSYFPSIATVINSVNRTSVYFCLILITGMSCSTALAKLLCLY